MNPDEIDVLISELEQRGVAIAPEDRQWLRDRIWRLSLKAIADAEPKYSAVDRGYGDAGGLEAQMGTGPCVLFVAGPCSEGF